MKTSRLRNLKKQLGFSLIELMIVIAIIGLLIGVGVPAWSYMVKNGNETAAIQSITQINQRQAQFASANKGEFGTFEDLRKKTGFNENFDSEKPTVNGYVFELKVDKHSEGKPAFWSINADPESPNSGSRHFYQDSNISNIHYSEDGPANAQSPRL